MDQNPEHTQDGCPKWADLMINQLKEVEIILGNIPKALAWNSSHVDDMMKKTFEKEEQVWSEEKAEIVFERITQKLRSEDFADEEIIGFFNARIGYKGGPQYCGLQDLPRSC